MANSMFSPGIDGLLTGAIDLDTAAIKVALVRGYTFVSTHTYVSDVIGAGGTLNGTSAALTTASVSGGVFSADNTTLTATASASNHSLLVFQASAVTGGADVAPSAQRLILWIDTASDGSLPIQPGSGTVNINWATGSSKIIKFG